ncbi:MAG: class I SAM-dependent methyltransferase [Planctomycetaceae bacterium]|jgi:23S rRNA (cytosine1962-C5)-methyltransferase|nr:class I SAM-dependent methyltransferase [Planctomycetaceae bacterium]
MKNNYELLDFGNGRRLERFGSYLLDRPCPAAEHFCLEKPVLREQSDTQFVLSPKNSERGYWTKELKPWLVSFGGMNETINGKIVNRAITMELCCTPFGHLGVFPEQQPNWKRIASALSEIPQQPAKTIHVLNLFAYTGASSLAAALAAPNISVVHVDSAQHVTDWAKRNAQLNGLAGIRFIVDDVRKFVHKELRRKHYYDAIILDPPSYGHGVRGEAWKLAEHLPELLSDIAGLLSSSPYFILLTAHSARFNCSAIQKIINNTRISQQWNWEKFVMEIPATTGKSLESGYGIFGCSPLMQNNKTSNIFTE